MYDLTGFQRDLLYTIAGQDEPTTCDQTGTRAVLRRWDTPRTALSEPRRDRRQRPRREGRTRPPNELLYDHGPRPPWTRSPSQVGRPIRERLPLRIQV